MGNELNIFSLSTSMPEDPSALTEQGDLRAASIVGLRPTLPPSAVLLMSAACGRTGRKS